MNSGDQIYNTRTKQTGVVLAASLRWIAVALPPSPVQGRQLNVNWPADQCELLRTVLTEIIRGKERETPSRFWNPWDAGHLQFVHPHETHIDFPRHDKLIQTATNLTALALRAAKELAIHRLSAAIAQALKAGKQPSEVATPHNHELEARVYALVNQLARDCAIEVRKEHHRLHEGSAVSMTEVSGARGQVLGAESPDIRSLTPGTSFSREKPRLIAELAVQDFQERLGDATVNVANDLRRKYSDQFGDRSAETLAAEIEAAVNQRSDGFIDNIGVGAARDAMRAGRDDAYQAIKRELEKLGKKIHLVRICAMEKASCPSCKNADGEEIQPGQDLTAIHEGPPETCECMEGEVA